jgi:4'-phosphopantetheinyl transferase
MSDGISLYVALLETIDTPQCHQDCLATLSLQEKRRAEALVFERHRRQYIFAHGLLRFALSSLVPQVKPSGWRFDTNRYGRPFIAAPATAKAIHFSLSHTQGCVACVLSGYEAVGLDVEEIRNRHSLMEVAQDYFTPEEIDNLRRRPLARRADRFFDYWTLKEAYLKARGIGFNLPLDRFSMRIASDGTIGIRFVPATADDPQRWHFMKCSPSSGHRLAVADGSGLCLPIIRRNCPLPG